MLKRLHLLFPIAILSATLAACGGGAGGGSNATIPEVRHLHPTASPTTTPTPVTSPSPTPTPTATPPSTTGSVIWKAGDANLGHWSVANTYQCGAPVAAGTSFTFALAQSGTTCARNQAQPTDSAGNASRLADGAQYTLSFHYVDGTPTGAAPGMGFDADARSLIFQIHPFTGGNPCVGLGFWNGGVVGAPQQWQLTNCNGGVWSGNYTPGEQDDWKIVMIISQTSTGHLWLYRNGTLVADVAGATYSNLNGGSGDPWWNFGPYKWRWEQANGGGSTLTLVNATMNDVTLTQQ